VYFLQTYEWNMEKALSVYLLKDVRCTCTPVCIIYTAAVCSNQAVLQGWKQSIIQKHILVEVFILVLFYL